MMREEVNQIEPEPEDDCCGDCGGCDPGDCVCAGAAWRGDPRRRGCCCDDDHRVRRRVLEER